MSMTPSDNGPGLEEPARERDTVQLIGRIPVRNLYLLMLYASELYRERGRNWSNLEDNPDDIPDLVGEILCSCVERRLRRALNCGYRTFREPLTRVRGRIDFLQTTRHSLLSMGKIACVYDALVVDTDRNRLVRTALERMSSLARRSALACRCRALASTMRHMGVTGPCPSRKAIRLERFGLRDACDVPMVTAALLALDLALPTEDQGSSLLPTPEREKRWVQHLFELGIAGFYRVVLEKDGWKVSHGTWLRWQHADSSEGIDRLFPDMKTDIVLTNREAGRRIVMDTKFTDIIAKGRWQKDSLRSRHIYQIYAYLRSQEGEDPLNNTAEGILLHPSVDGVIDEHTTLQGHRIRFATVDLAASARDIRARLVQIVQATARL